MDNDVPDGTTRRQLLGRGAALAGAAWVAPQIVSAPAAAAQTCVPGVLSWDDFAVGSTFTNATVNGVNVSMTTVPLPGTTVLPVNNTIRVPPNGSFNSQALQWQQVPNASGVGQDITFTFDVPVSNLSFTLADLDDVSGAWSDDVIMLTPGYTFSIPTVFVPATPAGNVVGLGTFTSPFFNSNPNFNFLNTSNRGNVTINYAGPISTFSFRYRNGPLFGGGNQLIYMLDMSWDC
ncbi:MAG: hypothetical protein JJU45_06485 [Acidimicrobiia bacterium]|nr:hypothetical protein [Acidimicrobiia bacterium]